MRRGTRLVGLGLSVLLVAAGLVAFAAAAERWWPACQFGTFDTERCLELQDHMYDYAWPREPWTSVGNAAELHAISLLLLAVAVALLPHVVLGLGPGRGLTWLVSYGVAAAGFATLSLMVWLSGWTGTPQEGLAMRASGVVLVWGWLVLLIATLCREVLDESPRPGRPWRVFVVLCFLGATPWSEFFLGPVWVGYTSHDTAPWVEGVSGVWLVLAGLAAWPAAARQASSDKPPPPKIRSMSAPGSETPTIR